MGSFFVATSEIEYIVFYANFKYNLKRLYVK